jgi:hypothetical protein
MALFGVRIFSLLLVMRDIEPKIDTYEENSLRFLNFEFSTACLVEVEP